MSQIRQAHDRMLTVDACIDSIGNILEPGWKIGERHKLKKQGGGQVDLPRMKEGGLDAAFFVVPVEQGERTPEGYASAWESAANAIDRIRLVAEENSLHIGLALSSGDAYRLEKEGKLAAFIGLGNGYAIGTDLSLIEWYHAKGVSYLTLCGDADNEICDSATDRAHPEDSGLSGFGHRVVMECNRVGMIIDVSHCSEKSFFDVLSVSRAPVIVSHSAARALCDRPDNMSDAMIRALAEKGGVAQVCFVPERLARPTKKLGASVPDIADHIDHVTRLVGIESVGIGSAFNGGGGVAGCGNIGEMLNLTIELLRRGYGQHAVEAIWGGNIMRVLKQVELIAELE
ncbi:MAG: dipeptidase [Candidatus Aminicenantes bacterium]|nr:dipeptidase [Candidatus Aminicenantes bacterium]